jgi:spore coat polysaccharide biosynthesis protein SpsF
MLAWVVHRLQRSKRIDRIVVATSAEASDEAIAAYCAKNHISCFRGSLVDVASRMIAAAEWCAADEFIRISADSPFIMPSVVDEVANIYHSQPVDLATNAQVRTFPKGMSAEVVQVAALRRSRPMMLAGEAEHVTQVFYRRNHEFRIANLASGADWGSVQLSVDTQTDFALAERLIEAANGSLDRVELPELIALHERCLADLT